ncbi:deoxyribose-phosphate aldolase [Thermaerobacter marianensis DSM 12885]|uniref:Deoxyribose-phosphate aldolase n=1 Tax=Thermaerobacter marianensis (strain ATCC 700841 / DSM 12885 / JCM 10246 / 7p75a) TaxID=644966 RepID=E6SM39_THEM7|nr:deoxyribose-phosphate aldolase [Thermaerobacter marianensis]ADU50369.1 deoxyribose-phosphate aldolase [Thermaerobacter marianensis DSM 12885]
MTSEGYPNGSAGTGTGRSGARLARFIQSTLIASDATEERVVAHCRACLEYGFHAAMVPPLWVPVARRVLAGSPVRVASFVDFPLGCMTTGARVALARELAEAGVDEIDVMVPLGLFKSGRLAEFRADLEAVVRAARPAATKAMLELPLLEPGERERMVELALAAGFDWLKNASGGAVGVATPDDIRFLRGRAPAGVGVKASGGIKTAAQAWALIDAGAELLGTSSAVALVTGEDAQDAAGLAGGDEPAGRSGAAAGDRNPAAPY